MRAALDKHIRAFLRAKRRAYLMRLVRHHAFALAVATALLTGATAHASPPIELFDIAMDANSGGFVIDGINVSDRSGFSVSGAGDVNGDGLADLIVGAPSAGSVGKSYVVFGKADGTAVELSDVALGTGGFVINGIDIGDHSGISVSDAGDVNGDGLADLIVGAARADQGFTNDNAGKSYVVFGKADGTAVELSSVASGTGGFVINGIDEEDRSGRSVSGAGDVNGDGLADLIVGAYLADANSTGSTESGESYVVFGKADGTAVELSTIRSGTGGFVILGDDNDDRSGRSVSGAGDVNGDGLADLIVGAYRAEEGPFLSMGLSYVVFGKADGTAVSLFAIEYSGIGGFVIYGDDANDESGFSVSGAGDVNGDGLADLIVGARRADPGGGYGEQGESYVVFGKASTTPVELSDVALGTGGFVINGIDESDHSGISVSGAGDVNGDGLDDLIVGAPRADPGGDYSAGESYVIFGKASGTAVELSVVASGTGGFIINGIDAEDYSGFSVSGAGDVNGDGLADLIVGAYEAPGGVSTAGESYVVFSPEPAQGRKLWVDFAFPGTEVGSFTQPFNTLQEALDGVFTGGIINVKGDTGDSDSPETLTINRAMTINAIDGAVTIGNPRGRSSGNGRQSRFVSRVND